MAKRYVKGDVYQLAKRRIRAVYEEGHRVVVSFSGGKDSCVCLELAIEVATELGMLPVEVVMMDEEILYPGTFVYSERVANRKEVNFHWLVGHHPNLNVYNREQPYYWTFDPDVDPNLWVRQPPSFAKEVNLAELYQTANLLFFPPPEGKYLVAILGLRVAESPMRAKGLYSSKGFLTKVDMTGQKGGCVLCRPIYDWEDGDVWKFIGEREFDYNTCYDVMYRMGIKKRSLRVAPPAMLASGHNSLVKASRAWPRWFERVCNRLPGVKAAVHYGKKAATPYRYRGESWQACFKRTCLDDAPDWIKKRAYLVMQQMLENHGKHSTMIYPDVWPCRVCQLGSWRDLTKTMWAGDPFSLKTSLPYVEPAFFKGHDMTSLYALTGPIKEEAKRRYGKGKAGRDLQEAARKRMKEYEERGIS